MAEIRKHQPVVTSAIDAALLEALGEPVRHVVPGEEPAPKAAAAPNAVTPTSLTFGEGSWVQIV